MFAQSVAGASWTPPAVSDKPLAMCWAGLPNHFSSFSKAGANLAARALWCLAGQCVRPTPTCAAGAGYDFFAATETDLSVAGFDVTGVACAAEDDVGTAVVTACGADGEEYAAVYQVYII